MTTQERHARRLDALIGLAVTIFVCCGLIFLNSSPQ